MKRICALLTLIFALSTNIYAQFPYATPNLTDGSISCRTVTTVITTMNNKVTSKSVSEATFSSDLKIAFNYNEEDLKILDFKKKPNQRLPLLAIGNNFSRTLNETEDLVTAKIPRFASHFSFENKYWGQHPCDNAIENVVLLNTSSGSGSVANDQRMTNVSIEGIKDEKEYFFVKVFAGAGWEETIDIDMRGKVFRLDPEDDDNKCKWFTETGGKTNMNGPKTSDVFLGGTDMPESFSKRSSGYYTRFEPGGNGIDEYTTEYTLLKIDTGQIFSYIRNPVFKSFSLSGSYHHISKNADTGEIIETTEQCTVILNFGKIKNELILSMENDDEYHNWLPIINTPASGYKLLKVKGELISEDDVRKDTLHFYLNNVSRYTGKCTNFPEKDIADNNADLWFPEEQTNKNVEWIDSFHVRTNTTVKEVIIDIECGDFAACGNISAKAVNKNVKGISKYDNTDTLKFPEDENKNFIADKWEKDVGIFNKSLRPESDVDALPASQKELGDGWTLFEEYRGFYSEKDFLKKSDNVQRKGEFIRTDPDYKDVFVYDATKTSIPAGLFETNFAPTNAAKLNWHMLRDKQVIHYGTGSINRQLLLAGEMNEELAKILNDFDHRWLNYNTPLKYRLKKHYCLFLMLSDLLNYTDIMGKCFHVMQNPKKTTPIDQCEIIIFPNQPKETTLQGIRARCESSMTATQKTTIAENVFISTTIHEMGHALGIEHHSNGIGKYDNNGTDVPISLAMRNAIPDKKSRMFTDYDDALCACGVRNCAMRYTMMYKEEFTGGELLTLSQTVFCNSTQKYTDSYGTEHPADGCFNAINAK